VRGAGETQPCVWPTLRTNYGSGLSQFLASTQGAPCQPRWPITGLVVSAWVGDYAPIDSVQADDRGISLLGSQYLHRIDRCRPPSRDVTGGYRDRRHEQASNRECDRVPWFYSKELACNEARSEDRARKAEEKATEHEHESFTQYHARYPRSISAEGHANAYLAGSTIYGVSHQPI